MESGFPALYSQKGNSAAEPALFFRNLGNQPRRLFNFVSQCPALSVPSGFTRDGLPTALQIVGRRYDDLSVLRIGAALERVQPWAGKRPPI